MSVEANKAVILRFFHEVLDGQNAAVQDELFLNGAHRHFPGREVVMQTGAAPAAPNYSHFHTDIHHIFGEGDMVAVRLTHHVTFVPNARFVSQLGAFAAGGKSVQWDATAVFRLAGGRIAEEWVNRDELTILHQLGVLNVAKD